MNWEHNGRTIIVNVVGEFQIEGDEDLGSKSTLVEAREMVEQLQKADALTNVVKLAVVDGKGHAGFITGINRTSGKYKTEGFPVEDTRHYDQTLYAPLPWIDNVIEERSLLNGKVVALSDRLRKASLPSKMGYGRIEAHEYPQRLDALNRHHAAAMAEESTVS